MVTNEREEELVVTHFSNNGLHVINIGFPGTLDGKESACSAGDMGLIPGSGRSPGGGYGNPLQYSCLENPKDRGGWWAKVHGVTKSQKETTLCTTNLGENPSQSLAGCCPLGPQVLHSSWLSRLKREATEM